MHNQVLDTIATNDYAIQWKYKQFFEILMILIE